VGRQNPRVEVGSWVVVQTQDHRSAGVRASLLPRLASAVVVSSLLLAAQGRASERWATLEAIHELENPRDLPEPGQCGELGAYQFREQTWRMYTQAPFSRALDRRSSDAVAVKHYNWLKAELGRRGVAATPYRIALAWNGGINAALDPNPPAAAVDYATRAANVAADIEGKELADAR
jgi:hypothetical protein